MEHILTLASEVDKDPIDGRIISMNLPEGNRKFSNTDVVKAVGDGITSAFVNYLAAGGFVDSELVSKKKRRVRSFPESALGQIRNIWEQKQQGVSPSFWKQHGLNPATTRSLNSQVETGGFYMGFNGDLSSWNFIKTLQEDPKVASFSLLYGNPNLLVATKHLLPTEASAWQARMRDWGLIPSETIDMIEVGEKIVTGSQDSSLFYGHVLMEVDPLYQNLVSAKLEAIQENKPEGTVPLTAQILKGRWNFMVNMPAASLEAFELTGKDSRIAPHVLRTAVLMARSHYSDSTVSNNEGQIMKESASGVPSLIWLATLPGIDDEYLKIYVEKFKELNPGLNSVTRLVTGEHNLMLEVVPESAKDQDQIYDQINRWKFVRDMRVYHVVSTSNFRGFLNPDIPRAYSLITASQPGQVSQLRHDIEQLGDPSSIRAYRVLGRMDTDIIAAISLDPKDPHRVFRIHEGIRMTPFAEEVNTFL